MAHLRHLGTDLRSLRLAADIHFGSPPLMRDVGERVVPAFGEPAARALLEILGRSDAVRAAVIGRLYARDDAR